MRTFRGYASRASAGILADDPQSPAWSRTDQPGAQAPGARGGFLLRGGCEETHAAGAAGCPSALDDAGSGEDLSPELPQGSRRGLFTRLGEALLPRLSFRALALALLVNVLLALGFARLVEEDLLRLPKPVFWISLASPAGKAAMEAQPAPGGAGSASAGSRDARSHAIKAGSFARSAARRLAGRTSGDPRDTQPHRP